MYLTQESRPKKPIFMPKIQILEYLESVKNSHLSLTLFLLLLTIPWQYLDITKHAQINLVIYVEYEADNTSYYDKYFSIIFADWGRHIPHFLWGCLSLCFRLCFLLTCDLADDLRFCFALFILFISCFRIIHHTSLLS